MMLPKRVEQPAEYTELTKFYSSMIKQYPTMNLERWFKNGVMAQFKGTGNTAGYYGDIYSMLVDYFRTTPDNNATKTEYAAIKRSIPGLSGLDKNEQDIPIAISSEQYIVAGREWHYEPSRLLADYVPISTVKIWDPVGKSHRITPQQMGYGEQLFIELLFVPGGYCLRDLKFSLKHDEINEDWLLKYLANTSRNYRCMDKPDGSNWDLQNPTERRDFTKLLVKKAFFDSMVEAQRIRFNKEEEDDDDELGFIDRSNRTDHNSTFFGFHDWDDCSLIDDEKANQGLREINITPKGIALFERKIKHMLIGSEIMDSEIKQQYCDIVAQMPREFIKPSPTLPEIIGVYLAPWIIKRYIILKKLVKKPFNSAFKH
jgi:hypothetical protein